MTENIENLSNGCEESKQKPTNIIHLRPKPSDAIHDAIDLLLDKYATGDVKNMVLVYTVEADPDNQDGAMNYIYDYWFGESSTLFCLGLTEYMIKKIHDYMDGLYDE